jgi:TPR repeat protein
MKKLTTALLMAMLLITSGAYAAGTLKDAETAYARGDFLEAIIIYKALAIEGDDKAQSALGFMYLEGKGVPLDYTMAAKLMRLSAEQGNALAQCLLGAMYADGKGLLKDSTVAYMWFNLSAAQGVDAAVTLRDKIAKRMSQQQMEEAQKLARECLAKKYRNC